MGPLYFFLFLFFELAKALFNYYKVVCEISYQKLLFLTIHAQRDMLADFLQLPQQHFFSM